MRNGACRSSTCILFILAFLLSCSEARLVKEPEFIQIPHHLAMSTDDAVTASLYWVVVPNGPGTWVEDAEWDEYFINVSNNATADIQINSVIVIDSLGTRLASSHTLKNLAEESKQTENRYRDMGIAMRAGYRPVTLPGTTAVGGTADTQTRRIMAASPIWATRPVMAAVIAVPFSVGTMVYGGVVNKKISEEIQKRSSSMPVRISTSESHSLDLFFPLAPSPTAVEINYTANKIEHSLVLDTTESLKSLHLPSLEYTEGWWREEFEDDVEY